MELQTDNLGKVAVTVDDAYWDIRKDYDKLVIVEVKDKYRTYISRKPVPAGTSLSNRKYWIPFSSLVEEIKLNYGKWFSTYGNLLGSNALILNNLQLELNNLLKNLSGIYLSADKDCIEIGTSTIVTLSFGTNNKEDGEFKLYKNNELIFEARNNSFELQEGVTSTTEFRLECVQNEISYIASWNVAEVAPYYIGSGTNYNDVLGNSNFKKGAKLDISGLYDINVDEDGKYFFICVPTFIVLDSVKMNGYAVPMQSPITVIEPDTNIEYKIWQSSNTYREGVYNIQINKYKGEESDLIYSLIEQVGTYSNAIQEANDKSQEALNNSIYVDNEDIEKDSNKTIRFANKDYNPEVFSGLGRIYLRKNIADNKNILTQDMINKPNTIYHIQYDYDLNGAEITVPEGCTLEFEGGKISNGTLNFANTTILGIPAFDCIVLGTININKLCDKWFISNNDTLTFKFLIKNAARNNISLELSHDYNLDLSDKSLFDSKYHLIDISLNNGFSVQGNGVTIRDNCTQEMSSYAIIFFDNCNNFTLKNLNYVCNLDTYGQDLQGKGIYLIGTSGDCSNFNITNIYQYGGNTPIRCGLFGYGNHVHKGINNSKFVVKTRNSSYGIAIEVGEDLDVSVDWKYAHRGVYACGVSNSSFNVIGSECTTPCNFIIGVSIKYDENDKDFNNPIFIGSVGIKGLIENTGSDISGEHLFKCETNFENHFADRTTPVKFDADMILKCKATEHPGRIVGCILNMASKSGITDVANIRVHDSELYGILNLCRLNPGSGEVNCEFLRVKAIGGVNSEGNDDINTGIANISGSEGSTCIYTFKDCTIQGISKVGGKNKPLSLVLNNCHILGTINNVVDDIYNINNVECHGIVESGTDISGNKFTHTPLSSGVKIISSLSEINTRHVAYREYLYIIDNNSNDFKIDLNKVNLFDGQYFRISLYNTTSANKYIAINALTAKWNIIYPCSKTSILLASYTILYFDFVVTNSIKYLFIIQPMLSAHSGFGTSTLMAEPTFAPKGIQKYNISENKQCYWNGTKWVDSKGMTPGVHKGNTEYRGGMPIGTLTEADWYGALDSTPEFSGFKNGVAQTQGDAAGTGTPHAIYFDRIRGKFLFESEDPNIPGNYLYWEKWVGSAYTPFVNPAHGTIYKENDSYWKYIAPKTNATLKLDPATDIGYEYFDTDLGKMVYAKSIAADGTASWVDANGMSC